uniref:Transferrin-like domain-containing protein n=1 Tax=Eptatretus burgeri TaxID=7764 RepID=A0A8C4R373_EPTBU
MCSDGNITNRPNHLKSYRLFVVAVYVAGLCALVVNGNEGVRWCVISTGEESKCQAFAKAIESHGLHLTCVKTTSHAECITAINENKADAVTLDGGDIFNAGKSPHNLQPIGCDVMVLCCTCITGIPRE